LNYAVQKTIDRVIFLRICEDRGTEDYGRLSKLQDGTNTYSRLLDEFRRADDRYNSGLFHFRAEKGRTNAPDTLTPSLSLDHKVIKDIVKHLYYPDSPYEFSVLPADILGQVYERFLGKTIRLTSGHQAKIEEKPEVRKAGGVYYTPKYIVDYIVENTLGRLLNGPDPENPKPIPVSHAEKIKVIDPACGSGSFLIEAYQYLLDWHRDQYSLDPETLEEDEGKIKRHSAGKSPKIYQAKGGEWKLTTTERKRILLNNIHGVDIDPQAVEVTKLSLLLKVLEGETQQTLQHDFVKERQRILPDLGHNIRCGNSLIGSDYYDQIDLLELDNETRHRINIFDWETAFPDVFDSGGFSCVIGNPPYDVLEKDRNKSSWPHSYLSDYARNAESLRGALGGKLNLYRFFLIRSNQLLRVGGRIGMIVPLSILADVSCAGTRRNFLEQLDSVVANCFPQKDNRNRRVFRDAKLSTVVLVGTRSGKTRADAKVSVRIYPGRSFDEQPVTNEIALSELEVIDSKNLPMPLCGRAAWKTLLAIHKRRTNIRLGDANHVIVRRGEINQTIYRDYITSNPNHSRLVKGVEIAPYFMRTKLSQGEREWLDRKRYLQKHQEPVEYRVERIAIQRITGIDERLRVVAVIVDPPAFFADSTNSIRIGNDSETSLRYILGILNSQLVQWAFKVFSTNNNVGTNELDILPYRPIDFADPADVEKHNQMVTLVDLMLSLHEQRAAERNPNTIRHLDEDITSTGRRIDQLVYKLYGLSAEEIKLVERQAVAN